MNRKLLALALAIACFASVARAASLSDVVERVQPKIAKIYGAGGLKGLEAYQSGVVISPSGHILTVWSYVLDPESVTVVLNDGRRYEATVSAVDRKHEIAVLKPREELDEIPYFDLEQAQSAGGGTRILAFSNCFSVATGDEAASVQRGAVMAVVPLNGRRGVFESTYRGPVYVLDAVTSNPGAAGGAITDDDGHLVGLIGRERRNSVNGTWLNYALPIEELRASVTKLQSGEQLANAKPEEIAAARNPAKLAALGIALMPDVLERTPAFIDTITENSPAATAGLQPDDLVLMINDQMVNSRATVEQELLKHEADQDLKITVLRGERDLLELVLTGTK